MTATRRDAALALAMVATAGVAIWLWKDSAYALGLFSPPIELGVAAHVDCRKLIDNSYVKIDGVPRFSRAIAFSVGLWSSSKKDKTVFPLAAQPRIFVQWKDTGEKSLRGGVLTVPGEFKGRLLKRASLSRKYEKLWEYFEKEMGVSAPLDAVIIIDGEVPSDYSWVFAVWGTLFALIAVNALKLKKLLVGFAGTASRGQQPKHE